MHPDDAGPADPSSSTSAMKKRDKALLELNTKVGDGVNG
jgi:hypothetical protein